MRGLNSTDVESPQTHAWFLVDVCEEVELEGTAQDERIPRGSYKGELGRGRRTTAFGTEEAGPSIVDQGSSHGM